MVSEGLKVGDRCWYGSSTNTAKIKQFSPCNQSAWLAFDHGKDVWVSTKHCKPLTDAHVREPRLLEPGTIVKGLDLNGKEHTGKYLHLSASGMALIDDSGKRRLLGAGTLMRVEYPDATDQLVDQLCSELGEDAAEPITPSPKFEVGDRVYCADMPQAPMQVLEIDGDVVKTRQGNYKASDLKLWEFKYVPRSWVKVKGHYYPLYISTVRHFKTEPDDGLREYNTAIHPDFETSITAQSDIEYEISEPEWLLLDEGDRVAKAVFTGKTDLAGVIKKVDVDDLLMATVETDQGEEVSIDLRDLIPLDLGFKIGDRVTEDLNSENAYKEGFVDASAITHGTIVEFRRSGGRFHPWVRWDSGPVPEGIACLDCLKPYEGAIEVPTAEPSEPLMTAEQVIEEMDRAMAAARSDAEAVAEPAEPEPAQPATFAETYEAEGRAIALQDLAAQINQAHADCEQAREIAQSAQQSALEHAKRCGELLLQAKAAAGHGNWESWREAHLQLPSSTAALYQRVADRWDELQEAEALTLRDADRLLRKSKPRLQAAAAKSATPTKSTTVVDLPEQPAAEPTAPEQTIEQRDYKAGEAIEVGGQSLQVLLVGSDSVTAVDDSGRPHRIAFKANPAEPEQRDSEPQLLGQPDIFYAIRKFALLNGRMWNEKVCDRVTADVMQLLGEWEP